MAKIIHFTRKAERARNQVRRFREKKRFLKADEKEVEERMRELHENSEKKSFNNRV